MVVNEEKHIQHNLQTREGSEGLAARFKCLPKTSSKLTIMRALKAGDCVLG
jgi:predicted SnoaL-like aldol condensation-catalyzing enzyme